MTLIERLEAAETGSRELDYEIHEAIGWQDNDECGWSRNGKRTGPEWPPYTTSIDAALTLVPEGPWGGEIMWRFGDFGIGGFVELNKANPAWLEPDYDPSQPPHEHAACVDSYSDQEKLGMGLIKPRPLALALCIAARKAREQTND